MDDTFDVPLTQTEYAALTLLIGIATPFVDDMPRAMVTPLRQLVDKLIALAPQEWAEENVGATLGKGG